MHSNMKAEKSIWPMFYCIMNLPPSLRHVPHVGMHMAGFDLGAYCSLDIFVEELLQLWNIGFVVDGQRYKVFLIEILTDSRGREKLMKVQGAGSLAGCSKCDFGVVLYTMSGGDVYLMMIRVYVGRNRRLCAIQSRYVYASYIGSYSCV
jgi:hypothetical protein